MYNSKKENLIATLKKQAIKANKQKSEKTNKNALTLIIFIFSWAWLVTLTLQLNAKNTKKSEQQGDTMNITEIEASLNYSFKNKKLLEEALTHASYYADNSSQNLDKNKRINYQRMEFLGDSILSLAISEKLYELFPDFDEGKLTKLRSRLVSRKTLKTYAQKCNLHKFIKIGKSEELTGGRLRPALLADVFESVIAAIYLDSDYQTCKKFILEKLSEEIDKITQNPNELNPKGTLQEILQALYHDNPTYKIEKDEGKDHNKIFHAAVYINKKLIGAGIGNSKRNAETNAAKDALDKKNWQN